MNTINLTQGNDHRLRVEMTRWDEPLALSQSSDVRVYAVSRYVRKTQLVVHYSSQDEGVLEAEWPSILTAGVYSLEVIGTLEGEGRWRMFAGGAVQVTAATEKGGESVTMTADSFDVKAVITVCVGTTGVTEELRQVIADMIEDEYNASERVRETNEADRQAAELVREQHEETRQSNEQGRVDAEAQRQQTFDDDHNRAAEDHQTAADDHANEQQRIENEQQRVENEQGRVSAEEQREATFATYQPQIDAKLDKVTEAQFNEIFN